MWAWLFPRIRSASFGVGIALALFTLMPGPFGTNAQGMPGGFPSVRVLLKEGDELVLSLQGESPVRVRRAEGGVWIEGKVLERGALPLRFPGPFRFEGRAYRGEAWVEVDPGGRLLLVNHLPLEEYLLGVLPMEMPPSFPREALKAQAVLARTYALSRQNPKAPYDLCATPLCQAYGGLEVETEVHRRAVEATAGEVVSYGGRPIAALYHADSGGMTAGSEEVFGTLFPYLRPLPDPFSPKRPWSVCLPRGKVGEVEILEKSGSGRVFRLRVLGREKKGPEATRFLRGLGLPSTLVVEVSDCPEGVLLRGFGAGHGLGMSQWSAKRMAEMGYGYREILGYFFAGTFLSRVLVAER
ncbi:MAG: SpoIID/LytB domain-containing protein [Thermaceae bacterium]